MPKDIKITPDGAGRCSTSALGKAVAGDSSEPDLARLRHRPTRAGIVLGTAPYMGPGQARGQSVDKRSDIWAFGCVLYEMLTGRVAFPGRTLSDTIAGILEHQPDWMALPAIVPSRVVAVLRRCLQKDRNQRARDIGDVRLALEGAFDVAGPQTSAPATARARSGRLAWMTSFAVVIVLITALALRAARRPQDTIPPEIRVDIVTPATADPISFALSPDGRQIVFVSSGDDGVARLWLRSLDSTAAASLAGTDGASSPFWSPDSRSVGFFAGQAETSRQVAKPTNTCVRPLPRGDLNTDEVILIHPNKWRQSAVPRAGLRGQAAA